jgi:hypothetical protein
MEEVYRVEAEVKSSLTDALRKPDSYRVWPSWPEDKDARKPCPQGKSQYR